MTAETIFAPATAPGRAGIAVFRLSGPGAGAALEKLTGTAPPPARRAARRVFRDPVGGEVLDDGIALWFPAPASFTGEDVAEIQTHGGRAVAEAIGLALGRVAGVRLAEPGEFSKRAFLNGKLDLTEAEGLADLIAAETEAQRRQARRQLDGALGRLYGAWSAALTRLLAHLEAAIDFSEEDLPQEVIPQVLHGIDDLLADIRNHLEDKGRGEVLRQGIHVVILGQPNAGKSTLLNALVKREAAIVSDRAGTTRDVIETHLDLGGYPVVLADTAGLSAADDPVEAEGVRRAKGRAADADLKLLVLDGTCETVPAAVAELADGDSLAVLSKADLLADPDSVAARRAAMLGRPVWAVSAASGFGLAALVTALTEAVGARFAETGAPVLTRARHRLALEGCAEALERARQAPLPELLAEDVRGALAVLGRITGRVDVEDLLDVVFRDFCIGK